MSLTWSMQPLLLFSVFAASFLDCGASGENSSNNFSTSKQPHFDLLMGPSIPLVGFGIGNLPHENIPEVVHAQLRAGALLIDTAHASNNEKILADAVSSFVSSGGGHSKTRGGQLTGAEDLEPLHVVTKVWYTHLGYERTKISIGESLANLANTPRQIYVHMLLHWPRCNDEIPWMNCEAEENNLPQTVKDAGPPPHLDKKGAFLQSWKAMEEIYLDHQHRIKLTRKGMKHPPLIASIGVSNFELEDMKELMLTNPRVRPQIYQGNSWLIFHDPFLMDYLRDHNIFFQSYAVMSGILQNRERAPNAYSILSGLSRELMDKQNGVTITEGTVVLAYFLHKNIGVIPRAASAKHQQENSLQSLSAVLPHLTSAHIGQLETAIPALMKGEDIHTSVSFMNALSTPIQIHWLNPDTKEEVLVSNIIHPGSVEIQNSHPGHRFVAYDPEREVRKEFLVDAGYGEKQFFSVEL